MLMVPIETVSYGSSLNFLPVAMRFDVVTTRFDELHPSEHADRIVAREIAAVIKGQGSRWAMWLS
jgi:hypothetical protein